MLLNLSSSALTAHIYHFCDITITTTLFLKNNASVILLGKNVSVSQIHSLVNNLLKNEANFVFLPLYDTTGDFKSNG